MRHVLMMRAGAAKAAPPERLRPGIRRVAILVTLAIASLALAQTPVEVRLGVADTLVSNAWNPVTIVTQNLPGATFSLALTPSAGALDGVPHVLDLPLGTGRGVQRHDVVLYLPTWREVSWRVAQGDRIVASGTRPARDRDDRPLDLLLSAVPSAWLPYWPEDRRLLVVTLADLPRLEGAWHAVATLLVDGSLPLPDDATLVTAAAMGVDVALPANLLGALERRIPFDGTRLKVAAGSLQRLPPGVLDDATLREDTFAATLSDSSVSTEDVHHVLDLVIDGMRPATWAHQPRRLVAGLTLAYVLATLLLLRIPAREGAIAALLVTLAAGGASFLAAPTAQRVETRDGLVLASGGVGARFDVTQVASLAGGNLQVPERQAARALPASIPTSSATAIRWSDMATTVTLPRAGRIVLAGPPVLTTVPPSVEAAAVPLEEATPRLGGTLAGSARNLGVQRVAHHDEAWWFFTATVGEAP